MPAQLKDFRAVPIIPRFAAAAIDGDFPSRSYLLNIAVVTSTLPH